jgi:hypothetical protein
MNTLSWLIYLADVSDSIDWLLDALAFLSILGGAAWAIVGIATSDDCDKPSDWRVWRRIGGLVLAPAFLFGVVGGAVVPETETVYAIAASELGESALKSNTGSKAIAALNARLDRQIANEAAQ